MSTPITAGDEPADITTCSLVWDPTYSGSEVDTVRYSFIVIDLRRLATCPVSGGHSSTFGVNLSTRPPFR